jgi:hypothetical protein
MMIYHDLIPVHSFVDTGITVPVIQRKLRRKLNKNSADVSSKPDIKEVYISVSTKSSVSVPEDNFSSSVAGKEFNKKALATLSMQ